MPSEVKTPFTPEGGGTETLVLAVVDETYVEQPSFVELRINETPQQVFSVLAEAHGLDAEVYRMLLRRFDHDVELLGKLAKNKSVPEDVRDTLLAHFIPEILLTALRAHLDTLPSDKLCGLVGPETWHVLVHSADIAVLAEITRQIFEITDINEFFKQANTLLDNMLLPTACVVAFYEMTCRRRGEDKTCLAGVVMNKIAKHPATPVEILDVLYDEKFPPKAPASEQRDRIEALAQNPTSPGGMLLSMVEGERSGPKQTKVALANPSIPGSAVDAHISRDEAKRVNGTLESEWDLGIVDFLDSRKNRLNPGLTSEHLLELIRLSHRIKADIRGKIALKPDLRHDRSFRGLISTLNALETHIAIHPNADEALLVELLGDEGTTANVRYHVLSSRALTPTLMEQAVLDKGGQARQLDVRLGLIDMTDGNLRVLRELLVKPETCQRILLAYVQSVRPHQLLTETAQVVEGAPQTMMSLGSGDLMVTPGQVTPVGSTYLWEAIARHPNADNVVRNELRSRIEAHEINLNTVQVPLQMMQKKIALEKLA